MSSSSTNISSFLTYDTITLFVGEEGTELTVHSRILKKTGYFDNPDSYDDGCTYEMPEISTFAAISTLQYLYGDHSDPFTDLATNLENKIAIADTYHWATKFQIPKLAAMAQCKIETMNLTTDQEVDYLNFVYENMDENSPLRLSKEGSMAHWFMKDVVDGVIDIQRLHLEILKDLFLRTIRDQGCSLVN